MFKIGKNFLTFLLAIFFSKKTLCKKCKLRNLSFTSVNNKKIFYSS